LLGTTAMIAAGAIPLAAQAQAPADQPLKLTVGGYFLIGYGVMVQDQTNPGQAGYKHRADGFQEDILPNVSGESKFSNGVTAKAFIQFRGEDVSSASGARVSPDTIKQTWISLKHDSFGELRAGDLTDARRTKGYTAPQVGGGEGLLGTNSPAVAFSNAPVGTNTTTGVLSNRPTSVMYFTPTIAGFQLALSYAPDDSKGERIGSNRNSTLPGSQTPLLNSGALQNNISAALSWDGKVGDFTIGAAGGYSHSDKSNVALIKGVSDANPYAWNIGTNIGYGPWKIGGAFEQLQNFNSVGLVFGSKTNNLQTNTFDVGGTYTVGPFIVGLAWSRGEYRGIVDATKRAPKFDDVVLSGGWFLGSGVEVVSGVRLTNYDPAGATFVAGNVFTQSYTGVTLFTGTEIKF
jgi:outer membrane protein OmpU